ncbi:sensor of ECF-type sigma factor [Confluentibacter lentus]|uniref:sensor of ECF-type sigma factor n=1 Tax=Confluentibacter lentus TaxID=1699412 RepID=UPI000C295922|nr:sensor of ECF-type sigma factor [Confluentibacter lentus]
MKTIIITLALCFSLNIFSQENKIKSLKVAFITEKLNLTEKEAQQFWPVYNAYDDTVSNLKFNEFRKVVHEIRQNYASISDEKANELLNKAVEIEGKIHAEDVKLIKKLRSIIPAKKILALKTAEEDFNRKMLEEFNKRRRENNNK